MGVVISWRSVEGTSARVEFDPHPMGTKDGLLVIQPEEQESFDGIVGLVESHQTGGRWGAVLVRSEQGSSGMIHLHRGEPEAFFILEGDFELCGAESVTPIGPGSFVLVPAETEHPPGRER